MQGEKFVSDNNKCIRTSKWGRGANFNFLGGKGMDVFWNDPMKNIQYDGKHLFSGMGHWWATSF
jgi:hypothetical protein